MLYMVPFKDMLTRAVASAMIIPVFMLLKAVWSLRMFAKESNWENMDQKTEIKKIYLLATKLLQRLDGSFIAEIYLIRLLCSRKPLKQAYMERIIVVFLV